MKSATKPVSELILSGVIAVLIIWFSAFPTPAVAQGNKGQDAVYSSNGIVGSSSFIDASMFVASGDTICSTIYKIFQGPPTYSAAVIDARGFPGNTGASMTCAPGWTPWNNGATFLNKPSTILLPAGTIVIPTAWVLPSNTRLIGEGENNPLSSAPGTTIQAASGLPTMIQFGSSSSSGISVEQLTLDGQAQAVQGIVNQFSQTNTYVDHVTLYQILGTGLLISGSGATDSGPYTNITFDTGIYAGLSSTVCAQIIGTSGTRGIHGLKCKSETHDAAAAVLLDASNNSIADVSAPAEVPKITSSRVF